jgi:HSP20 family molecular chaperone IbpA
VEQARVDIWLCSLNGGEAFRKRRATEILRCVVLPKDVDGSKVSTSLEVGVVNIQLPKVPHAKNVRIEPKSVS